MAMRRNNWFTEMAKSNVSVLVGFAALLITFYFTTKFTLDKHEAQFAEVNKTFEKFNATLKSNYDDYAKNQKEEAVTREKTREQLMGLFTQLSTNSAATNVKVENIIKTLDGVTGKIDSISTRQQQNQQLLQRK